jgi:putative oxidoreductase
MLERYQEPLAPYVPTVLRLIVGVTFIVMGLPKLENPAGFLRFVAQLGFPAPGVIGWLPVLLEPIGGLLLVLGLGTRWISLYFVLEMLITTVVVKALHGTGFTVSGRPGVGYELDLLLLAGSVALVVLGAGALSVDESLVKRMRPEAAALRMREAPGS